MRRLSIEWPKIKYLRIKYPRNLACFRYWPKGSSRDRNEEVRGITWPFELVFLSLLANVPGHCVFHYSSFQICILFQVCFIFVFYSILELYLVIMRPLSNKFPGIIIFIGVFVSWVCPRSAKIRLTQWRHVPYETRAFHYKVFHSWKLWITLWKGD